MVLHSVNAPVSEANCPPKVGMNMSKLFDLVDCVSSELHFQGRLYHDDRLFILDENDERLTVKCKRWKESFGGEPKFEQMKSRTVVINYVASPHHLLNVLNIEVFGQNYDSLARKCIFEC